MSASGAQTVTLRDGAQVTLRPIRPDDKERLREAFERLGEDSRYRRFFSPVRTLSPATLHYLTEVDHHDHEALVAQEASTGEGLGVARYVRVQDTSPDAAEAAVAVVDDWQGRGLGTVLLRALAGRARDEGITTFTALVQGDNPRAMRTLSALGEVRHSRDGGHVLLRIALPEQGPPRSLQDALRAAAQGWLVAARTLSDRLAGLDKPDPDPSPVRPGRGIATIVVGTDGSPIAAPAVATAVRLASQVGATLHLVGISGGLTARAVTLVRGVPPDWMGIARTHRRAAEALGEAALDARAAGVETTCHRRTGEPADVILSVAKEVDAGLIVVGSRGLSASRQYLLASVPGKISHHAPCSVLIVRTE
ncbi:MAG TPA: GNAT family N-acetyltransferase [Solirubrobacteraceae bacterium]|nr:GNAT family N-acetyltransferase [Solirubrobacteraceae bacterium]